jgi:hypothetical protein
VAWVEEECGEVSEVVVVGIVDAEEVVIHQLQVPNQNEPERKPS